MNLLLRRRLISSSTEEPATVDSLERSDLPGVLYSKLGVAMNAVASDYPNGLTKDVTINCIKLAKETRNPQDPDKITNLRLWLAVIKDWNKNSSFSLTINGNDLLTLSGYSLGIVHVDQCDNIIFKNIKFIDYSNYIKSSSPEEMAAIYSTGSLESKNKNIVVINCVFEGVWRDNSNTAYYSDYAFDAKLTSNVIIQNCKFLTAAALAIKVSDVEVMAIKQCYISGAKKSSIAHEALMNVSGATYLEISDCDLDGSRLQEYGLTFIDIKRFVFKRNKFHNFAGTILDINGADYGNIHIESCIFFNNLTVYLQSYLRFFMRSEQPIDNLTLLNNVMFFDGIGPFFQHGFSVNNNVNTFKSFNNIFIVNNLRVGAFTSIYGTLGTYESSNNLYKAVKKVSGVFDSVKIIECPEFKTSTGIKDERDLADFQSKGYEANSESFVETFNLLNVEANSTGNYALLDQFSSTYISNSSNRAQFDLEYKRIVVNSSAGAYNLQGQWWNENLDTAEGYKGLDTISNVEFNNEAKYLVPSGDDALLFSNTLNRNSLIRFKVTSLPFNFMRYGNVSSFSLLCVTSELGMYQSNVLYDVELIKETL